MKTRLIAASATLAASLALGSMAASAATPSAPATKALQYLAANQQQDGSIDGAFGETADYTLGAAFHGIDPKTLKASPSNKTVFDYFTGWVSGSVSCSAVANTRDGNSIGKLVQAVVAGGFDPTSFGGRNLLADLEGAAATTGGAYDATTGTYADCGSYDAKTSTHQNAVYAQANAILGIEAANNPTYPLPPAAIARLRTLQDPAGSWSTFGAPNTSASAMALMALGNRVVSYCGAAADPTLTAALAYLHTQQDPASGGFTYSSLYGTASDPDSDALVIQALTAVGQVPDAPAWSNAKGNAVTDIATFQDSKSGGFSFDHSSAPQAFATTQVPPGLDRAPFPTGSASIIAVTCPAPSPSATVAAAVVPRLPAAGRPATGAPAVVLGLLGLGLLGLPLVVRGMRRQG